MSNEQILEAIRLRAQKKARANQRAKIRRRLEYNYKKPFEFPEKPERNQLSKEYMLQYCITHNEIEWYQSICNDEENQRDYHVGNNTGKTIKVRAVRKLFIEHFNEFKYLLDSDEYYLNTVNNAINEVSNSTNENQE